MPVNIEIKASVNNFEEKKRLAEALSDTPCRIIEQEDVFFGSQSGRLKLRLFSDGTGELIFYERSDQSGAKQSDYLIYPVNNLPVLRALLSRALGVKIVVKKKRFLYLTGQTRIHLDVVEGLGNFIELEVVMKPLQDTAEGYAIARELMQKLQIEESELVAKSYADLLTEKR
ncbi:MAG: class IV adenylate cyclase [Calditrichia bacterium]